MSNAFDLTVKALREQGLNSDEILDELSRLFQNLEHYNKKFNTADEIEVKIRELLKKVYMPVDINGYNCWAEAIRIYKEKGKVPMSTVLYPEVARICGTTRHGAERVMRHAVERVFERCPEEIIASVFENTVSSEKGKLTNSEFLVIMAEQI